MMDEPGLGPADTPVRLLQERQPQAGQGPQMFLWEQDMRTGRQIWDAAAAAVIGCAKADLPDSAAAALFFVDPADHGWLTDLCKTAMAEHLASFSATFRGRDGRIFQTEARIDYDDTGAAIRTSGVTRDTTAEAEMRHRLAQSEARTRQQADELRAIYEAAPVGLCVLDRDLRILRVNEAMLHMHGRAADDLVGRRLDQALPEIAQAAGDHIGRVLQGESLRDQIIALSAPGDAAADDAAADAAIPATVRLTWVPLRDDAGAVQGAVLTTENLTLERSTEQALADREALLAAVGDSSPEIIYAKNTEGRMLYANAATLTMLGLPLDQVLGRTSYELMPNSGGKTRLMSDMKVMATGRTTRRDEPVTTMDGRQMVLHTIRAPLRDTHGRLIGLVGLSSDVTTQRAAEARQMFLLQLADQLRSDRRAAWVTVRALGRFFGVTRAGFATYATDDSGEPTLSEAFFEEWSDGIARSLTRTQGLTHLGDWIRGELAQGRIIEITDVLHDNRIKTPAAFLELGTRAALIVPLLRDGAVVATLYLADVQPRDWQAADTALVRDVAERSWTAVERERTELALRRAEARHRTVLEASAAVIWSTDTSGGFATPQDSWAAYTGQGWPDHAGQGWARMIHPDDLPRLMDDWQAALSKGGGHYQSEGRIWHGPSGRWRHFVVRGAPLVSSLDGHVQEWIGAITDIDDQRRAEDDLRLSETRLRLAKEAAGLGIFELDLGSGAINWDAASLAILRDSGKGPPTLDCFVQSIHPTDRAALLSGIEGALSEPGEGHMSIEIRIDSGMNVRPIWLSVMAQVSNWPSPERGQAARPDQPPHPKDPRRGETRRLVGSLRDITTRKQNEIALQSLNRRLADRMEQAVAERDRLWSVTDDFLATTDSAGVLHEVSDSWARMLGRAPEKLIGRPYAAIFHPEDLPRIEAVQAELFRHGGSAFVEARVQAADGDWRPVNWRLTSEPDVDRLYAVGRDMTSDHAQARALAEAQAQLHEAQKIETIGQLTGGVAHDFNNLLAAILSNLRAAQTRTADPRLARLVAGAVEAAERGALLTGRLLAFARRQELSTTVIDLAAMIAGLRDLLEGSLGPQITLCDQLPADLPTIRGDLNQLELALLNLAVNARDAMPQGGTLTISARAVDISTPHAAAVTNAGDLRLEPGAYVVLAVTDTGSGMDETTRRRATEPFFTTKGVGKGTGLGLSMVYGLAVQLGGTMLLKSAPGQGTTVALWLPVDTEGVPNPAPAPPFLRAEKDQPAASGLCIVVVDDDPLVAMGTSAMLEDLGHRVIEVNSAAAALDLLTGEDRVDLVLTDHAMPGMTGSQLATEMRARGWQIPVALATGYAELPQNEDDALPRLAKPFGHQDLAQLIQRLCGDGKG